MKAAEYWGSRPSVSSSLDQKTREVALATDFIAVPVTMQLRYHVPMAHVDAVKSLFRSVLESQQRRRVNRTEWKADVVHVALTVIWDEQKGRRVLFEADMATMSFSIADEGV